jgi:acetyl-CoA/propionyl-CoA carboxylase biotin carboxyl carrier protein
LAIGTLLVANRGEVALRIFRAARQLGLRTVAVYSDADQAAPHVAAADHAIRIGPSPAALSYLSVEAILRAADRAGADAVHPGYGFLAESAAFATACEAAGLTFVGPQPDVIELMSRKDRARQVALEVGAPVLSAVEGEDTAALVAAVTEKIGFPAMVKAVAGGGGKGMRVATGTGQLEAALASAGREAMGAFGDSSLLVERYLPGGRHLEVQVVGDGSGKVVHLFDRDCSVQRRHQKVIEEAPGSVNSTVSRSRAMDAALRIAAHVSYRSLGTVEFLAIDDEVYFLEMNTRLQVEHPVTEAVTGIDLVEMQLRLAGGEPLTLSQDEVSVDGHAIEVRVYAEDPDHEFLPQVGQPRRVCWPGHVRVDAALEVGQQIGTFYDPMLAKLVAHGPTREQARQKMLDALDATAILGVTTNLGFLRRLVSSEWFERADIHTSWLDGHLAELGTDDNSTALIAAALFLTEKSLQADQNDPFGRDGWRAGGPRAATRLKLSAGQLQHEVVVSLRRDHAGAEGTDNAENPMSRIEVDGHPLPVEVRGPRTEGDDLIVELDGRVERFAVLGEAGAVVVAHQGANYRFELGTSGRRQHESEDDVIVAPLPGVLVVVEVAAGDSVLPGDVLGVLESMKMEYQLKASFPATIAQVAFGAGAQVARGDVLFELAPPAPAQDQLLDRRTGAEAGA